MTGAEIDTLIALVENGPLWDGEVPSKSGRDILIQKGLAVRVVVQLQDGYTAATCAGRDAYKDRYGGEGTMKEAKAFRQALGAINSASARTKP